VSYDAIVAGAGIIGASCAVHLARAGLRVLVLDRAAVPGAGSTGRATGGFRAQFGTAINIRLSLLARESLHRFRDDTGVDPDFRQVGYLWLAGSEAELAALADAQAVQHREGLTEARMISRADIAELNPSIETSDLTGAAWCPTDGVLRPLELLRGYLETGARLGVDIRWNEPIVSLGVDSVTTSRATYATGLVVNAAGAWAAPLAKLAGLDLPVVPLRRQVAITEPTTLPATTPLTIWLDDGFHVRVRDDRVLLLRPTPGDPDPWSDRVDPAWLDAIAETAGHRVPALRGIALDRAGSWAGLYEQSPDGHALLGFLPGATMLFVNGSSGHGVMHAPALGLLAAELAVHGETRSLAVHALRPARFAEGQPIRGSALL
jgi:sarcosine oxidase subunit beta